MAGVFNWSRRSKDSTIDLEQLGLKAGEDYFVSDFWDERHWLLSAGQPLTLKGIPAHGTHLLAVRKRRPSEATLVATTFHYSQGAEVTAWQARDWGLAVRLELGRRAEGHLRLALPGRPINAAVSEGAVDV